ncbi:MAG TPA: DUF3137 domain-containing protein [Thermoplasmata archaeon]|nr:DUF3137 domain-containing protein [Thermoplasmata archaeon]
MGIFSKQWNERCNKEWGRLAHQAGLSFRKASFLRWPKMEGEYRGHEVSISYGGFREYGVPFTTIRLNLPKPAEFSLAVYWYKAYSMRSIPLSMKKSLSVKEMRLTRVENPEFDELFKVKESDEAITLRIVDPPLQKKILSLKKPSLFFMLIQKNKISLEAPDAFLGNTKQLKSSVDILVDIAEKAQEI